MSNIVLESKGIEKSFHDGSRELKVLCGVDLTVTENEILAISGASGAGKSTLLQIMGTLDTPTAGDIFYNGESVRGMNKSTINALRNESVGFVFQFYHLLQEFTALENVMMPGLAQGRSKNECRKRAEELLSKVGLEERMTHKPSQLSGGEQQRVAIGRALFNKPGVLLADEPTGNLDENTGEEIVNLLWDLNQTDGITLVMVTHDLGLAAKAHSWVHLHEGVAEHK
jgi:lipoprotein-releasing system ATP-binding protein